MTMLPKLLDNTQTISFSEGDGVCSAEVFANDVVVTTNAGNHNHGSSKVKLKNLVDYNWEPKFYSGQLLAIHISGKYLAYCIKAPNPTNPGTWNEMVRVVYSPEPNTDKRGLIKGMKGEVQDLSFAFIHSQVLLACIDEQGCFYVHEIEVSDRALRCTLIAEVLEDTGLNSTGARVVWCPYIPDDDDSPDDDVAKLLLTTHSNVARMWNVRTLSTTLNSNGANSVGSVAALCTSDAAPAVAEHAATVVTAAFSPDGTALATASADGYVMFFQVFTQAEQSPRCLHKWQPHGGKPLSSLFFLDNHKNYNSDVQFWKFAVTGAENNNIIKVWSCKSWHCLQTITFTPSLNTESASLGLKAVLDTSANYLLLSDFRARSLYVLNMARDRDDTMAYAKSIAEFLLPYPVLSFCIADAEQELVKCDSSCSEPYHSRNGSEGDGASPIRLDVSDAEPFQDDGAVDFQNDALINRTRIKLYIVQPKGLQEGLLVYTPISTKQMVHDMEQLSLEDEVCPITDEEVSGSVAGLPGSGVVPFSILQQQTQQIKNLLMRSQTQPGSLIGQRPESPPVPPALTLMTPDAFSSPGKRDDDDPPLSATPDVTGILPSAPVAIDDCSMKLTSGGSSPSREVQQIMQHDAHYYKEEEAPCAEEEMLVGEEAAAPPPPVLPAPPLNGGDTSWPQISIEQIASANQRKATSDKSSSQSLEQSLNNSYAEEARLSPRDKARLDAIDHKLDKLTELVTAASRELRTLRAASAAPALEQALHAHAHSTAQLLHKHMDSGWERVARIGEAAGAAAGASAASGAARALEPLALALQHELAAKLSATDALLQDNLHKLANSKTMTDKLSASISASLADMVRESLRSALASNIVPLVEKAHAQMFRQISQTFQNGVKEFVSATEKSARAAADRGGASAAVELTRALQQHTASLQQHASTQQQQMQHTQKLVQDTVKSVLEKEMTWLVSAARSVASRAHSPSTPAPQTPQDRQLQVGQIQALVRAGDVNGAFQLALSAADLALVMAACRAAEPAAVFAHPPRLRQHVLLSLVQQLSADMHSDTVLKYRYLEEAVMTLDSSNPVTREHLPVVMRELQKQIVAFLNANAGHALTRQFKMLLMAAESLVKTNG